MQSTFYYGISGAAVVASSIACGLLALLHLPVMRRRARAPLSRVRVFRMAQCRPEPRRPSRDVREAFSRRYRPSDDICPAAGSEFVTNIDRFLIYCVSVCAMPGPSCVCDWTRNLRAWEPSSQCGRTATLGRFTMAPGKNFWRKF